MNKLLLIAAVAISACTQTITPAEPVTDSVSVDSVAVDTLVIDSVVIADTIK
jgi:hypothetical protein